MLSRKQLEDISNCCEDKFDICDECSFCNECDHETDKKVAKTALELLEENEKLSAQNREYTKVIEKVISLILDGATGNALYFLQESLRKAEGVNINE